MPSRRRYHVSVPGDYSSLSFKSELDVIKQWVRKNYEPIINFGLGTLTVTDPIPVEKFGEKFEAFIFIIGENVYIDIREPGAPNLTPRRF